MINTSQTLPVGKMGLVVVRPGANIRVFGDLEWHPVEWHQSHVGGIVPYSWMGPFVVGESRTLMPPMQGHFGYDVEAILERLETREGYVVILERPVNPGFHLGFVWSDLELRTFW